MFTTGNDSKLLKFLLLCYIILQNIYIKFSKFELVEFLLGSSNRYFRYFHLLIIGVRFQFLKHTALFYFSILIFFLTGILKSKLWFLLPISSGKRNINPFRFFNNQFNEKLGIFISLETAIQKRVRNEKDRSIKTIH